MINLLTMFSAIGLAGNSMSYFSLPKGLEFGVRNMLNLRESGPVFPVYVDPPFEATQVWYLYEVLNPNESLKGAKVKLKPRGPFIYKYHLEKFNISFTKTNDRVGYNCGRTNKLTEEGSENYDKPFYMINPTLMSVAKTVRSMVLDRIPFQRLSEPAVFGSVNVLLDQYKERLFVKKSARQILDGEVVALLDDLMGLANRFGVGGLLPPGPPGNIFGLASVQAALNDRMEVFTGIGNPDKFADVYKWRNNLKMPYWKGKCNTISGTNGELFKPFPQQGKPLKTFFPQMCRTIYLIPKGPPEPIQNGLIGIEYEITPQVYLGTRTSGQNQCYCSDPRTYECQLDGLVSMGPCFFDAPIFLSRTNFKGVSRPIKSLIDNSTFDNNMPDHQSIWLDPITGSVLKVNVSVVGTVKVVRQRYVRDLDRVQNISFVPLFITVEAFELPNEITWQVKALQKLLEYHKPANLLFGCGALSVLLIKLTLRYRRANNPNNPESRAGGEEQTQTGNPSSPDDTRDELEREGPPTSRSQRQQHQVRADNSQVDEESPG